MSAESDVVGRSLLVLEKAVPVKTWDENILESIEE